MYRTTRKKRAADRKFAAMRATRARTRLETDEPIDTTMPYQPPELRRVFATRSRRRSSALIAR